MDRHERLDVVEGDDMLVFVDDLGGHLVLGNLAKHAVWIVHLYSASSSVGKARALRDLRWQSLHRSVRRRTLSVFRVWGSV